jgi:hypothetical protein
MNDKIANQEIGPTQDLVEILSQNLEATPQAVSAMLAAKIAQEVEKHQ